MTTYTANDITVLKPREHVRLRTQVYLGNMTPVTYMVPILSQTGVVIKPIEFIPAVLKAVNEIIENSIDEFSQINAITKTLAITACPMLGSYTISDNGRGIPISKHKTGSYTPEIALGHLMSGRNFDSDKIAGIIGQNGVGSACVNFCSTEFTAEIFRDGKKYLQRWKEGAKSVTTPIIRKIRKKQTGTTISFQLDTTVFDDVSLPNELVESRCFEIAMLNPDIVVIYNGTRLRPLSLNNLVKKVSNNKFVRFDNEYNEFFVLLEQPTTLFHDYNGSEKIYTWANSSMLYDGGLCNTQFRNAFCDKVISQLERDAKKNGCIIAKTDILEDVVFFGNLKISDPAYDSQSKTRLTGPNLRRDFEKMLNSRWSIFARKNKDWFEGILEKAIARLNKRITKEAVSKQRNGGVKHIEGLIDATNKNRLKTQLLITEGKSAASMITQAREPSTTASLPLQGKVNNVYAASIAQISAMGKVADLLTAIGLIPGKKALRGELRYGKIVIATDADFDGNDIFTLLVNLFFQFWPELFDPKQTPIVYRLVAPNICLVKGKERKHFVSLKEYNKSKTEYKGWTVKYYKGLGSMSKQDWDILLQSDNALIPIVDNDGEMKNTLDILFGKNADKRKEWLG